LDTHVTTNGHTAEAVPLGRPLPKTAGRRALTLLGRALLLHCPYCGGPSIFKNWWTLKDRCPTCGIAFDREEGFFLGAYAINLLIAEFLGLGAAIVLLVRANLSLLPMELIAVAVAIGLPLLFFPFSRTLWLALDAFLHPAGIRERQLRRHELPADAEGPVGSEPPEV